MLSINFYFPYERTNGALLSIHSIARSFVSYMQIHSLLHTHAIQAMQAIGRWQTEQYDSETV